MFAVDTSSMIAYIEGGSGKDVDLIAQLLTTYSITLPAPVIVETLSNARTRHLVEPTLRKLIVLDVMEDFWYRASALRANVLARNHKANIADTLIAQACIDHNIPLITRDKDFRQFTQHGLKLA
jgi:predicted nucleic acid-binding protein